MSMLRRARKHRSGFTGTLACILLLTTQLLAQHRGDNLAFQGLAHLERSGAKALAMGGAFTAMGGDLNSIFWNPAGLAGIEQLSVSVAGHDYAALWRENQAYRPNRYLVTLPFYLEGLYIPDPANNGILDDELAQDTNYVVGEPELGLEPFSKEAADWQNRITDSGLNSLTAAVPLKIARRPLILALAYQRQSGMLDYDRNDTYLSPHIGSMEYEVLVRVESDTGVVHWHRFLRQRSGDIQTLRGALALALSDRIQIGLRLALLSGETEDLQTLSKVGVFDIYDDNKFSFSYDTLDTEISGTSTFSAVELSAGALFSFTNFDLGFSMTLPTTVSRSWTYETAVLDTGDVIHTKNSGTDQLKLPPTFTLGLRFTPAEQYTFALDLESIPYSQATFELASQDTTHRPWIDSYSLRVGIEYRAATFLALRGGYQYVTQEFVPDGAAFKTRGPAANWYTIGASFRLGWLGQVDIAYNLLQLKYYDSYYSSTNYVSELVNRLTVEYIYRF